MKQDYTFEYMMLGRLKSDCENYINGVGVEFEKVFRGDKTRLWAHDERKQIDEMFRLYDLLPVKPEWLTREDIKEYARKMNVERDVKKSINLQPRNAKKGRGI